MQNITVFDNLSLEDVRDLYKKMEKEQTLSKYNFPTKPSSDGYFHVWVTDPSKKNGRRQIKAKHIDKLKEKVYEYEKGINGSVRKTFRDVFELYLEQKLKYIKNPEKRLSVNNTVVHLRFAYTRFFSGTQFEKKYIDEISKTDIENLCYQNLDKHEVKKKAFLEMRGIIKQVFKLAYEQYWVTDNVYDRVNFKKYNDMLSSQTPISKRMHSEEDLSRMLDYVHECQRKKPDYIPAYALELQILAGLRRGEIPPIEWSDVTDTCLNINKEQLIVRVSNEYSKQRTVIVKHTKNYVDRSFPMTDDLKDFFMRLKVVIDEYFPGTTHCFPDRTKESGVISNNIVYSFYVRMCEKLNITICKDMVRGPHSFRRNGITRVSNAPGGNIMIASVLYGNSPQSVTSHYYSGVDMRTAKQLLESNHTVTKI